ncbi:hypothetical protein L484_024948 [Morus notabilis]|uniref:Uncharacterized protein n=1 Tax=Morus notabilis TaxID=981085 RepID=W9RE02_9ROSA|nr:hypothetical protein L484_024948 [Morus notabilis]
MLPRRNGQQHKSSHGAQRASPRMGSRHPKGTLATVVPSTPAKDSQREVLGACRLREWSISRPWCNKFNW